MSDDDIFLAYRQRESKLIDLIKQSNKINNSDSALNELIIRTESDLEIFETMLALNNRSIPEPHHFWKAA